MVDFHSVERIEDTRYTSSTQFLFTHLGKLLAPSEPLLRTYCVASYRLVHLAQRWDDESGVNLYHCEDDGCGFVRSGPLEDYAHEVRLP
jgi:hypothetical protein